MNLTVRQYIQEQNTFYNNKYQKIFLLSLCTLAITILSYINYLLFHSITELFCMVVGLTIFIISFNTYSLSKNNYMMFLGIAYFFISIFDFIHTLSYSGMGIFPNYTSNLPTQLWIITRYGSMSIS